ncbi:3-oxoacyl-[acyl-carrier-protein] reductase [Candidatus Mesenet endosymbiont of Agriotes lineatus]|uniref:3-oxoacyl-[acyl-carrier-protein] reductase n=1 Tax=Candidatus Mesenet endosymbiont of Agriotes lineatus TaxID=3077948 RepID=UPI0030D3453B
MFNLAGKKFLVTGASGGIGQAITDVLYKAGATLCISGTRKEILEKMAEGKNNVYSLQCDLTNSEEVDSLVDKASDLMAGFDGIVCNAGVTQDSLLLRMTDEAWDKVININLTSTFKLNKKACSKMLKNGWGRIINISSIVGFTGNPGQVNYATSKAGMVAMSKCIAKEFASRNITVNCIAPGFIETSMTSSLSEEQQNNIMSNIPLKRMGIPKEVASGVLFLASDEASYITGQTLHINGGLLM